MANQKLVAALTCSSKSPCVSGYIICKDDRSHTGLPRPTFPHQQHLKQIFTKPNIEEFENDFFSPQKIYHGLHEHYHVQALFTCVSSLSYIHLEFAPDYNPLRLMEISVFQ